MGSDTQVVEQQAERDEVLKAMRQMATDSRPVRVGDEVSMGDIDAAAIIGKIVEPGVVSIYDTHTGECSRTSRHMLNMQLGKLRADGTPFFSQQPPRDARGNAIEPRRGKLKCMLHPDDPNRALYDSWGLAICTKDNLSSPQQVKTHVRKRHTQEWDTIEGNRLEIKEREDREIQRRNADATLAALTAVTAGQEGRNKKAG